jgi:hypothetical protein
VKRSRVELEIDETGIGSLRVDGTDVAPAITRVVIHAQPGEIPRVELWIAPGSLAIDVDGNLAIELEPDDHEPTSMAR